MIIIMYLVILFVIPSSFSCTHRCTLFTRHLRCILLLTGSRNWYLFYVFISKLERTYGKKLHLKFGTSGIADQDHLYALLDTVVSDNEDNINNLIGDSDSEFEAVSDDVTEDYRETQIKLAIMMQ